MNQSTDPKNTKPEDQKTAGADQNVKTVSESKGKTTEKAAPKNFKENLMARIQSTKTTRWIRFTIIALIFIAWVVWMESPWLAIFLFLLFDIYITGFIPFTWWKKSKSKAVRTIMSWVDAIVYALILVYFVFAFIGQNYQIPSESLEKTLLRGDYLWVNKMAYGPRVPMTPVNFPLVHNTLPIFGCDSYLDSPSISYKRLKGLRNVESGDIVVFNFPAGDTVATNFEESPQYYETLVKAYGWHRVNTDKATFGDIKYRPVDRRSNFVKRAVGLPGQRLKIQNDTIYIDGKMQPFPENVQFKYVGAFTRPLDDDLLHEYGIVSGDVFAHNAPEDRAALFTWLPTAPSNVFFYELPMTAGMIDKFKKDGLLNSCIKINAMQPVSPDLFPEGVAESWTLANYGGCEGLLIPKKGMSVKLTPENWFTYKRVIRNYENHPEAYIDGSGTVYIAGKPAETYTFAMDYYFMMGDNRDLSQDSRFWGFVPEDHIVGTPAFILVSIDKDRSIFNGGIRWNRIFRSANPDKK